MDKTSVLYGESNTGKSFIITDILYQLQPYIDQIIVISPTDRSNHTYDKGTVPLPLIHYSITAKLLDDIWARQSALASVYTSATNPTILKKLFEICPENKYEKQLIQSAHRKLHNISDEVYKTTRDKDAARSKVDAIEIDHTEFINMVYRSCINKNRSSLQKMQLSKDEEFSVKYLNINPRLVLIFDDCTDQLREFRNHKVIQKLFNQGRWAYITTLIACHAPKVLDKDARRGAFNSIFTGKRTAIGYYSSNVCDLDKDGKASAIAATNAAFTSMSKFQKLLFVRDDGIYYKFTASKHVNFKFGCEVLREYCNRCQTDGASIPLDNKFINGFL